MMKARLFFATVLLLGVAAVAGALDQPNMQAARTSLQTARNELQKATPDKGGHRANAIKLITAAIQEVNAGIGFARSHNHASLIKVEDLFGLSPDQPHMQNALTALGNAKDSLDKADPDKGGHRAKALGFVNDAIDEVKKGIDAGRG